MLFKRGKIEAKQDSNILEDSEFLEALLSNRSHSNTLVHPQIEFDQGQIRKLKQVHKELFHESNPHNEAKEAASLFKEKATDEWEKISSLIGRKDSYPFVEQLRPLAEMMRSLTKMDYATLITEIGSREDELLDLKEDVLDPIRQFMNGGQKEIYDRLTAFEGYNQANFDYVEASEKEVIHQAKSDPKPYLGNTMKLAKEAMDTLEDRVKNELYGERDATTEKIRETIASLKSRSEFEELNGSQQAEVLYPLQQELKKAENERFIGNLRDQRHRLSDLYTDQLNRMQELATPEDEEEPKQQFIKLSNIHVPFNQKELKTEEDVDEYLQSLKEKMVKHIQKNHNIILD
jgi:hypothetical protein